MTLLLGTASAERPSALLSVLGCTVFLFVLVGLVLCVSRMRGPFASRKSYLSFICFGTGWLTAGVIGAVGKQSSNPTPWGFLALGVFGLAAFVAVVLAFLGLSEIRRDKKLTGKAPAVTTLVLAFLILATFATLFGAGVLMGLMKARDGVVDLGTAESPVVVEQHGYSVHPRRPWIQVKVELLNPLASSGFRLARPEAYFLVIAEEFEPEMEFDLDLLAEAVKGNLEEEGEEIKILEEAEETINGLVGRKIVCEAKVEGMALTYRYWLHVTDSRSYQLIAWGNRRDAKKVIAEAGKVFETFTLVPPKSK